MAASGTGKSKGTAKPGAAKPRSVSDGAGTKSGSAPNAPKPRSPRRRAREYVLQSLYAWQMTHSSAADIESGFTGEESLDKPGFGKADKAMFSTLLLGTIREAADLQALIEPAIDRKFEELSPVERAVLLLGAYELKHSVETPYRVILNEAIELAKSFGGTDGHKYVNGVLDKLVVALRPYEREGK